MKRFKVYKLGSEKKAKQAFGEDAAYRMFVSMQDVPVPPPFDVFCENYSQEWFQAAYPIRVEFVDEMNTLDALRNVQERYMGSAHQTKRLKGNREELVIAALRDGASADQILNSTSLSIYDIQKIKDANDIKNDDLDHEIDLIIRDREAEKLEKHIIKNGPKGPDQIKWNQARLKLKDWKKQRLESKKNHNGDEWYGCDFSEDEYNALVDFVENGLKR